MVKMGNMQDKDFDARKDYFKVGAHEVIIVGVKAGKTPTTGSEYLEFELIGPEGQEGTATLWLTEKAAERSRSIMGAIAVHNKDSEADKQKVRDAFKQITDTDQMKDAKFLARFENMEAWILTEEDLSSPKPTGGFYLRNNLYSYPPTPRKQPAAAAATAMVQASEDVDLSEIPF